MPESQIDWIPISIQALTAAALVFSAALNLRIFKLNRRRSSSEDHVEVLAAKERAHQLESQLYSRWRFVLRLVRMNKLEPETVQLESFEQRVDQLRAEVNEHLGELELVDAFTESTRQESQKQLQKIEGNVLVWDKNLKDLLQYLGIDRTLSDDEILEFVDSGKFRPRVHVG